MNKTADSNQKPKYVPVRLVETRTDFLFVYFSSMLTMLAMVLGAWIVQAPEMLLREIWYVLPSAAITALAPPIIGRFLKTGRRTIQIIFGAVVAPLIGSVIINGLSVLRAIPW